MDLPVQPRSTEPFDPGCHVHYDCRDPEDLPVIGTALAGGAHYLVTGDKDLLYIREFRGTAILTPREFYEVLSRQSL
jgi:predicted nucleic acid-binding protein